MRQRLFVFFVGLLVSLVAGELVIRICNQKLFSTQNLILTKLYKKNGALNELILSHRLGWELPQALISVTRLNWIRSDFGELGLGRPTVVSSRDGLRVTPNISNDRLKKGNLVVTLGDSFTFGGEVSDEETWPAHLQAIIKRQIFNGGLTLYGIDQSFLKLREMLKNSSPSLVILSIMQQSILRTQRMKERWSITGRWIDRPSFVIHNNKLLLNSNRLDPDNQYHGQDSSGKIRLNGARSWLGKSHVADFIFGRFAFDWWYGRSWGRSVPKKYLTDHDPKEISCLLLKSFQELSRNHKFQFVVLGQHYWQDPYKTFQSEPLTKAVLQCAKNLGILTIDLEDSLRSLAQKSPDEYNTLYFPGAHMTNRGNWWVAQEISQALR